MSANEAKPRRRQRAVDQPKQLDDDDDGDGPPPQADYRKDHAPRKGGWDLSGDNAAAKDAPTRPTRMRTGYESDEDKTKAIDEDEIMEIPTFGDSDMGDDIRESAEAEAPLYQQALQSLRELDADIGLKLPPTKDAIDVTLLSSVLLPSDAIRETDTLWDFDSLLMDVSSALEKVDEHEEDDFDPDFAR